MTHNELALLSCIVACVLILTAQKHLRPFVHFSLRIWLPLAVGLCVVWGLLVKGDPSTQQGAGIDVGLKYATNVSLRLLAVAALFQASILSLNGLHLAAFFSRLALPPDVTAGLVSILNLWPDFSRRADEIVAARSARGLMRDRRIWTRLCQVPWSLRTLFVGSLSSSFDRAHRWQAEALPEKLANAASRLPRNPHEILATFLWCGASTVWLIFATNDWIWP